MITSSWVKSTRSGGNGGQCVECRQRDGLIEIRDSKDLAGLALRFSPQAFVSFVESTKRGDFDR